jgi:hypothetical protein
MLPAVRTIRIVLPTFSSVGVMVGVRNEHTIKESWEIAVTVPGSRSVLGCSLKK